MNNKRTKIGHRAVKDIFIGYASNLKVYCILGFVSNIIVETRDVDFIENKFYIDSTSNAVSMRVLETHEVDISNKNMDDKIITEIE